MKRSFVFFKDYFLFSYGIRAGADPKMNKCVLNTLTVLFKVGLSILKPPLYFTELAKLKYLFKSLLCLHIR